MAPDPAQSETWVPALGWRAPADDIFAQCTFTLSKPRRRCPQIAVAEYNRRRYTVRGAVDVWVAYCAAHLYGRRIIDGVVCERAWRKIGS